MVIVDATGRAPATDFVDVMLRGRRETGVHRRAGSSSRETPEDRRT
jgi:hypothetical protein